MFYYYYYYYFFKINLGQMHWMHCYQLLKSSLDLKLIQYHVFLADNNSRAHSSRADYSQISKFWAWQKNLLPYQTSRISDWRGYGQKPKVIYSSSFFSLEISIIFNY